MRLWRLMILMEMMLEVVIGVLVMEVDKLADEVTNMDVDKVTNMMAKITNEDFSNISLLDWNGRRQGGIQVLNVQCQ